MVPKSVLRAYWRLDTGLEISLTPVESQVGNNFRPKIENLSHSQAESLFSEAPSEFQNDFGTMSGAKIVPKSIKIDPKMVGNRPKIDSDIGFEFDAIFYRFLMPFSSIFDAKI